jgi:hypothetical protein
MAHSVLTSFVAVPQCLDAKLIAHHPDYIDCGEHSSLQHGAADSVRAAH